VESGSFAMPGILTYDADRADQIGVVL